MSSSHYVITCPTCGTKNRIPAAKEGLQGRCGNCHAALAPLYYRPLAVDEQSFNAMIRTYPGPILAEFWAPT